MFEVRAETTCVYCSSLGLELRAIVEQWDTPMRLVSLTSMLHLEPDRLDAILARAVEAEVAKGRRVLLLLGDCSPHIIELAKRPDVGRVGGRNCCEMVLGEEVYREFRAQGAFFLLPEWAGRWREVFAKAVPLPKALTKDLMKEVHSSVVYLDTGVVEIPDDAIRAFAEHTGLPARVEHIGLDEIRQRLERALEGLWCDA